MPIDPVAAPAERRAPPFNPFERAFSDNPYPTYHRLRASDPLFSILGCLGRDWIVTSHSYVERVLSDDRFAVDDLPYRIRKTTASDDQELCRTLESWMFFMDGPDHAATRRSFGRLFAAEIHDRLRRDIAVIANKLVERHMASGGIDVIADLAQPLPALVTSRILGLPEADASRMAQLSAEVFSVFTQPLGRQGYIRIAAGLREISTIVGDLLEQRRRVPAGDLVTRLAQLEKDGAVSDDQILAFATMLLSVGQETTQNLIGNAVHALLTHPDQLRLLISSPALLSSATRELARFDTPVQLVVRMAKCDLAIDERTILAGERMHLFLGAAHRDPKRHAEPDRLILQRPKVGLLPFGGGPHFCLGAHLAQLQAECALESLLPYLGRLQLATPRVEWIRSIHMRGLEALPLALQA